jgi:hypothetical protein
MAEAWPDSELWEFLSKVTPEDSPEFICQLFRYLGFLVRRDLENFWNMVPVDFILGFLDAQMFSVHEAVLQFVKDLLNISKPEGIIEETIVRVLVRFPIWVPSSRKQACCFLKESVRKVGNSDFIMTVLERLYPKECDAIGTFSSELVNGSSFVGRMVSALANHIDFNKNS